MFLRHLKYLAALAETEHFGRAAEICEISQPTLSSGIQHLENELGVTLVQRRHHRFVGFTSEGKHLLVWARRILADWEGLRQEAGVARRELTGELRIGAIPTSLPAVPLITSPYIADHPRVKPMIHSLSAETIIHRLDNFTLDLGITYLEDPRLKGFKVQPLYEEHYVLLARDTSAFGDRTDLRWSEIGDLPLCLLPPNMQNRRIVNAAFREAGIIPNARVETDSIFTLYAQIRYGGLFSIVPHSLLCLFEIRQEVSAIRLHPPLTRMIGAIAPKREPWPPVIDTAWSLLDQLDLQSRFDALIKTIY
ncbi:MAG: LysR family transcriptional regulator [Methylothermaceae bacterium]|nr:LysR family transcriptional regulator [Methylothermaceae bacterium]